ncbi:hypothetical protein, partial [Kitasatospora sp. NPDC005856]|uniref:hypothetical protein n=1 Tax=Kitasatospora sp. NPDC005856 TaxID=3154566 RepID=UPI0033E85B36
MQRTSIDHSSTSSCMPYTDRQPCVPTSHRALIVCPSRASTSTRPRGTIFRAAAMQMYVFPAPRDAG